MFRPRQPRLEPQQKSRSSKLKPHRPNYYNVQQFLGWSRLVAFKQGMIHWAALESLYIKAKKLIRLPQPYTRMWVNLSVSRQNRHKEANSRMGKGAGHGPRENAPCRPGVTILAISLIRVGLLGKLGRHLNARSVVKVFLAPRLTTPSMWLRPSIIQKKYIKAQYASRYSLYYRLDNLKEARFTVSLFKWFKRRVRIAVNPIARGLSKPVAGWWPWISVGLIRQHHKTLVLALEAATVFSWYPSLRYPSVISGEGRLPYSTSLSQKLAYQSAQWPEISSNYGRDALGRLTPYTLRALGLYTNNVWGLAMGLALSYAKVVDLIIIANQSVDLWFNASL